VFELTREHVQGYTPERAAEITGVHADNIRAVARKFANAKPGMIYAGYRSCKWLHGDKLHRAWLLMCALTGSTGQEGGGMQTTQLAKGDGLLAYAFNGVGPRLKVAAVSLWDYAHADHHELNRNIYGEQFADRVDAHYREAVDNRWIPDFGRTPWKMGFMAGHNPGNWRASAEGWRQNAFLKLETIVAMTPNMSVTAMYSDYVLPIADHYERQDFVMEGRTPYVQVIDQAVPPLGEAVDDWAALERLIKGISERAAARGIAPVKHTVYGNAVESDYAEAHELFVTVVGKDGQPYKVEGTKDIAQFIIENSFGMSEVSFDQLMKKGFVRVDDADGVQFGKNSNYSYYVLARTRDKLPYETLTGRQQFYFDHDWFLQEGEALPEHRAPLKLDGYGLRLTMGHARHGVHSMWRDDSLLVALQRGEPDVFVNPTDAEERGVADGELIKVFNSYGSFVAQAHVSSNTQPGTLFMYHGWDPMQFRGRENFSSVISTGGLLKPTSLVGGYGHLNYRAPNYVPNQTYHDTTVEFQKA
jgi:anaerobic selenocysteine-containing dehydrogenase